MSKHPIFAIQNTEELFCLRVQYATSVEDVVHPHDLVERPPIPEGVPGSRLSIVVTKEIPDETNSLSFSTMEELEAGALEFIIDNLKVHSSNTYDHHAVSGSGDMSPRQQAGAIIPLLMGRQGNLIATRTRRGCGNFAVVSPFIASVLAEKNNPFVTLEDSDETVIFSEDYSNTKLVHVGVLNNRMQVYSHSGWKDDHSIIIGYKGENEIDAAMFCSHLGDNYRLSYPINIGASLGNWSDYFGVVGITESTVKAIRENVFVPSEAPIEQEVVINDGELRFL